MLRLRLRRLLRWRATELTVANWLVVLCFASMVLAIRTSHDERMRELVGPLSEWVPGVITAFALVHTLDGQRRADRRMTLAEQQLRDTERRKYAETVFAWLGREADGTFQRRQLSVLHWANLSTAPAFDAVAILTLSHGGSHSVDLGTIPPNLTERAITMSHFSIAVDAIEPTPSDQYPISVRIRFRDVLGQTWERDDHGRLTPVQ